MVITSPTPRVAVIGGSIAGCAAAMAAHRAGCDVTVYERSGGELQDRGFGVTLPTPLYQVLSKTGYLSPDAPALSMSHRLWIVRETGTDDWRELWRQSPELVTCNWGLLWKSLRANVPDSIIRTNTPVAAVRRTEDGRGAVSVEGEDDAVYDLVIGADGYRSVVRQQVVPGSVPGYAGYIAFRGVTQLSRLQDDPALIELLSDNGLTVMYGDGHMIVYAIPDLGEGRRINWVLYFTPPSDINIDPLQGAFGPDTVVADLIAWSRKMAAETLPGQIGRIVTATPDAALAVQPVVDLTLPTSVSAPFLLTGDANTITRPHTGSGAVKALQDGLSLEQALSSATSVDEAVTKYNAERNVGGNQIVELGRRIGRDQVERTPDWTTMTAETMARYVAATWSGQKHYLFDDED